MLALKVDVGLDFKECMKFWLRLSRFWFRCRDRSEGACRKVVSLCCMVLKACVVRM